MAKERLSLKPKIAQGRMVVRTHSKRPEELAVGLLDRSVVDAGDAAAHQALLIELPVLVAVTPEPGSSIVMPLVSKANGNPVLPDSPELLDQPVVEFTLPLAGEKGFDGFASGYEFGSVAPSTVDGVRKRHARRIARVPAIFCE